MRNFLVATIGALALSAAPASASTVDIHPGCEFLLGSGQQCLAPFPDDFYTRADRSTATGRRVDFQPSAMPENANGVPIDPAEWNRNDGFSPGITILLRAPGVGQPGRGSTYRPGAAGRSGPSSTPTPPPTRSAISRSI